MNSWGTRIAIREELTDNISVTAVYSYAGALTPDEVADGRAARHAEDRHAQLGRRVGNGEATALGN